MIRPLFYSTLIGASFGGVVIFALMFANIASGFHTQPWTDSDLVTTGLWGACSIISFFASIAGLAATLPPVNPRA